MEDAFNSISKHARAEERTKAYHKPRYEDVTSINKIHNQQRVSNEYPNAYSEKITDQTV